MHAIGHGLVHAQNRFGLWSNWESKGSWTVPTLGPPTNVSVSPSSNSSPTPSQSFTFVSRSPNGAGNIEWVHMMFNYGWDSAGGCYLLYHQSENRLYMRTDNGGWGGSDTVPGTQTIPGTQCNVDAVHSTVSSNNTDLTLNVKVNFNSSFIGRQSIFMVTSDYSNAQTPPQQMGYPWTAYAMPCPQPPSADSVSPGNATGSRVAFAYQGSSCAGYTAIPYIYGLINPTASTANGCYTVYNRAGGYFVLLSDAGTEWAGWGYPGNQSPNAPIGNSQCTLYPATSSASASNQQLTVNMDIGFTTAFGNAAPTTKNNYLKVADRQQDSGWVQRGTWSVAATSNPSSLDLPDTPFGKGPPAANAGSCGIADCSWFFSSITYVPPTQMYGLSGTYSVGPNGPFYTNHTSARMVNEFGQDLGLACSGESISYGSSVAYARVPCDSQVNFYLYAPHLYTLIGRHQTNNGSYTAGVSQTFDSLGFVPAGASWDFTGLPMGPFSDFRYSAGPTIAPSNDGVTVRYTAHAVSTVSVHIDAPYSARKGRHQLGFPTYDIYGFPAANEFFAIIVHDSTPVIATVSPSSVPRGTQTTLTITGTGFGDHPTVFVAGTAYNPGAPSRNAQGQDVVTVSVTLQPPSQGGSSVPLYMQSNGAGGQAFFGSPQGPQQGSPTSNTKQVQVQPVTATLTNTPLSFIPRNSIGDACQIGGCTQQYTVTLNPPTATGIITFQLNSSSLRGYATNACFNVDCTDPYDSAPDYWFEGYRQPFNVFNNPANNDQTIQTTSAVNSATVTVSSRDFGGTARLSATVNGTQVTATVTETQELFARIPIDICRAGAGCRPNGDTNAPDYYSNGIADSWETAQAGRYLDQNEDNEEGWPGSASRGDGYSAHDEYRGFITWDGTQVVHVRTDPVAVKDVFYYDAAGIADSLRQITGPQTAPYMNFYQILPKSANFTIEGDPTQPVRPHNRNTIGITQAFATVYIYGGPPDCAPTGTTELGVNKGGNNGTSPITIMNTAIACFANRLSYSAQSLLGQVVAHETGHKFGIQHPSRKPAYIDLAALGSVSALGADQFTIDTSAQLIYVWLSRYTHSDTMSSTGLAYLNSEHVARPAGITNGNAGSGDLGDPSEIAGTRVGDTAIHSIHYMNPLATAPGGYADLFVEIQEMLIMDWSPNFYVTAWAYNARDILAMCVKQTCP